MKKHPPDLAPQTGSENRVARYVEWSSIETPFGSSAASGSFRSSLYLSPA